MKSFSSKFLLAAVMALAASAAGAQDFKIGVVVIDRIFREANSAKAAQAKLEQEFGKREKDIAALETQLKSAADKFDREAPTLSESQRVARQKQLVEQEREFQRKRREFQEDLNARKSEELQQLIERANKVVKTVAEAEKYDLILQEAVYANPKHDITDKVIRALNAAR
ncbi:OmpH family outer membrane protein [Polaromonas sp. AER18D-145]|uniref:OmpH family outer membrane protein n=1 Tax=Polaromonas sp. AER18D-145 TaxID=1977060 RepID=UPI000BBC4300|nr:OmpH family outer membrane protein [Polaromonas sp. AER18D-145]